MIQSLQSTTFGRAKYKFRNKDLKSAHTDNSKDIKALRQLFKNNPQLNDALNSVSDDVRIKGHVLYRSCPGGIFELAVKKGKKGETKYTTFTPFFAQNDKGIISDFKSFLESVDSKKNRPTPRP